MRKGKEGCQEWNVSGVTELSCLGVLIRLVPLPSDGKYGAKYGAQFAGKKRRLKVSRTSRGTDERPTENRAAAL